jgi:lipid A 3-O-deacylase
MRRMARALLALILFVSQLSVAAAGELGLVFGRSTESDETDIVRLTYRHPLAAKEWWMPNHLQFGGSLWRVPDIRGTNQRLDLNVTPVWRSMNSWGYVEAGIGGYLLSKTINSPTHRLPSSFQFGSHLGVGVRLGEGTIGIALQHLSNAGLKQPNGGIDLILVQYTVSTGTPNR